MGKLILRGIGNFCGNKNTAKEHEGEVSYDILKERLSKITAALMECEGYACYVMGMGAHPKQTYQRLKKTDGVKVIWTASVLPGAWKLLSVFISSYAGLIKIDDPRRVSDVFLDLSECSMAGIYIFPQSVEGRFVAAVKEKSLPSDYAFGLGGEDEYFYYVVDADNAGSSTGIYELLSCGVEAHSFFNIL